MVKQIKFEGVWGKLEARNCFQRQSFTEHLRQTLVFMWNSALRGKVQYLFFSRFLLLLTKFSFREEDWVLLNHQKVSKYYEHESRSIYVVSMWSSFSLLLIIQSHENRHTCFFRHFWKYSLLLSDDNMDRGCGYFPNSKNSASGCCLAFA